ncbi:hypothetical protein [Mucilaginibacter sp.]|uniref:hypothetical protein n=1 Tax=Mucilaginibacter sp. TaxID=1882438 RepID=UPI0026107928|nr:hypothetical protein [Mucilaginibacter sp.]MDB4926931.1 hypothetical protein [Mucilaginibacter sp.]
MPKKILLILFIICFCSLAKAQTADAVYDQYLDYNLDRLHGDMAIALKLGESILPNAGKLPAKARISFYNSMAKLYEDNQPDKAIIYYEMVTAAEPNYYVAHRALGYLYAAKADKAIGDLYKAAALKALPNLEKAQACDPSAETLALIKLMYTNIHDEQGLKALNTRLAALSKNCLDILSE